MLHLIEVINLKDTLKISALFAAGIAILSVIANFIFGSLYSSLELWIAASVINMLVFFVAGIFVFSKKDLNIVISEVLILFACLLATWIMPNNVSIFQFAMFGYATLSKFIIANIAFITARLMID